MSYVRVKQKDTGHELSVDTEWAKRFAHGLEFLTDGEGNPVPATDRGGAPLPPKYRVTVDEAAAAKVAAGGVPYLERLKADLEKEVADRNDGRTEDQLIVVDAPGNKPELAAALDADDQAAAPGRSGIRFTGWSSRDLRQQHHHGGELTWSP